jgi:diphthamide biosynthesis protein 7
MRATKAKIASRKAKIAFVTIRNACCWLCLIDFLIVEKKKLFLKKKKMEENGSFSSEFKTLYPADSVEFCPIKKFNDYLVCGTYKLIEETREKIGKIYLFQIIQKQKKYFLKEIKSLDTPAILDLKWSYQLINEKCLLGQVGSDGSLSIFLMNNQNYLFFLHKLILNPNNLCLSLDWNNKKFLNSSPNIIVSSSNSILYLCQIMTNDIILLKSWNAHDYENWIACFDYWNSNLIYSGADDCKWKGWDIRENKNHSIFSIDFSAGVTSIQSNPNLEYIIAVGNYNEKITIWDSRILKQSLSSCEVGGGVWRIKWHPYYSFILLSACMRAGFKILNTQLHCFDNKITNYSCNIISSYRTNCENLAYGIDWCYRTEFISSQNLSFTPSLAATCSFYDNFCSLWDIKEINS